ncbi:MAG: M67 family metallopeptidase [Anaerolineae bacterium]|nr:M67 family metallopeptidase [Anaerolineae bacterium]
MKIVLQAKDLRAVEAHLEAAYPNEGAGLVLGRANDGAVTVEALLPATNQREAEAQHNRYELGPADFVRAEREAARRGLDLVGVFHSHPDHPNHPSEFDREHALPNFSYLITTVAAGKAGATRAWRLREDRQAFDEDVLEIV